MNMFMLRCLFFFIFLFILAPTGSIIGGFVSEYIQVPVGEV